jgi:murein DD-endopeptidase MepM/ murein hydrolase activator NlpD
MERTRFSPEFLGVGVLRIMPWVALVVILALAGCGRSDRGAPVVYGDRAKSGGAEARGTDGVVVVRPGDSVYKIAKAAGVGARDLIDANRLNSPYRIYPGQRLVLPRAGTAHFVRPGESVATIATNYGVESKEIVRQNNLAPPYRVKEGQEIRVPATKTVAVSPAEAALAASAAQKFERPEGGKGASVPSVAAVPAGRVQVAAVPALPPPAGSIAAAVGNRAAVETPRPAEPPPPPAANPAYASLPPDGKPAPEKVALPVDPKAGIGEIAPPAARSGKRFLWPVKGDVIAGFGPREGGLQNDGINIKAGRGATVKAAENGVVAYAGNELRGFGNLLLIKHADGWMSAYAHNDALLVKAGDKVKRGQPISRVGSTGNVGQPQLHFELRRGTRAVDPMPYLGGGEA